MPGESLVVRQQKSAKSPLSHRLASWGLQLLGLMLILFLIHLWQTRDLIEGAAPSLSATTLDGLPFDLGSHNDGPVLVHFWASWCPVCKLEAASIQRLSEDYQVVTVAMQSGKESEVIEYLKAHELSFTTINDPMGRLASAWRVKGVPTSYLIDKDHNVRFVTVGYTPELTLRLRLWLLENHL